MHLKCKKNQSLKEFNRNVRVFLISMFLVVIVIAVVVWICGQINHQSRDSVAYKFYFND